MRSQVGFDYDYTLANYRTHVLGYTIYELAKEHLISARQYPESLASLKYDPEFAVRGVAYDTRRGYLLNLDFLHAVSLGNAFFGRRRLTEAEIVAAYGSMVVTGAELAAFRPMVDLFCLPEACLISDVIQHFVDRGMPFHPGYVYQDVKAAVGYLHESGVLHGAIAAAPSKYIEDSEQVVTLLRSLRAAGRKTFLLTNSGFKFVNSGMNHITRASLGAGEWMSLFDLVCVGADKPSWYKDDRPFRSLNITTGKVRWVPIDALLPGHVYHGGSFAELNRLSGGGFQGQHVLYLGDHVFSDLSKPSRIGWRTGAIINELEREVELQSSPEYRALLSTLMDTERQLRNEQASKVKGAAGGGASWRLSTAAQLAQREQMREELKVMFNSNFGSVFRTHSGATLFTQITLRYSDIYTSHVENLLQLAPDHRLYPTRRSLPHEPHHPFLA